MNTPPNGNLTLEIIRFLAETNGYWNVKLENNGKPVEATLKRDKLIEDARRIVEGRWQSQVIFATYNRAMALYNAIIAPELRADHIQETGVEAVPLTLVCDECNWRLSNIVAAVIEERTAHGRYDEFSMPDDAAITDALEGMVCPVMVQGQLL